MCKGSAGCAVMRDYHSIKKEWIWSATLVLAKTACCIKYPKFAKFTRAMVSQHMYYINNSLFYISNFIVQPSKFCTVPGSFVPGGFKNQMGKFCWVVRFVPGGGHWTYAPMTPPWYKTNNQAKFAPKITKQNLLGWTMKMV